MALEKDPVNLIITGVGGQGNVLASQIVASAGIKEGLYVTVGETYGASQRGGSVMSHVRFSSLAQCSPLISEGQADILVGMEPVETLRVMAEFGNPETKIIVSPRPIFPPWVLAGQATYPPIEEIIGKLEELAKKVDVVRLSEDGDTPVATNVLMMGALAASGLLKTFNKGVEAMKKG
jgi:indolepyruvate ferredoxin oxidoreductase beta subunit